jgi:hypothetical protein
MSILLQCMLPFHLYWVAKQSCKQSQLGAKFILNMFILSIFISLYTFRVTMCPSSGEATVFLQHLVFVILYGWLSGTQSSTQNNKYQVSHKQGCFFWWWAHSRPELVEIDKYTKKKYAKNKLCTKLASFTRLYPYKFRSEVFRKVRSYIKKAASVVQR